MGNSKNFPFSESKKEGCSYIYLRPFDFQDFGTWIISSLGGISFSGIQDGRKPKDAKDAVASFEVPHEGKYYIWVHTNTHPLTRGKRYFHVSVNGEKLDYIFGNNEDPRWIWEYGREIVLKKGTNKVGLIDSTACWARVDGVLITDDAFFRPHNDNRKIMELFPSKTESFKIKSPEFGTVITGKSGGVQPAIFAPVIGEKDPKMDEGSLFEFSYRPVTMIAGWFDAYRYVIGNIYKLKDYRKNWNPSLTDQALNIQDLIMDDDAGGWDNNMKGHYNMEGRDIVAIGDPLTQIQSYLLTEDRDIYIRRTIPTIEFMLSREKMHFTASGDTRGSIMESHITTPSKMEGPVGGLGNSVFGGAYMMTQGMTPVLRYIGIDNGFRKGRGDTPDFAEYVWLYKYTGNNEYLEKAIKNADEYIEKVVYAPNTQIPRFDLFIYISYYPYWQALLDLYEVCNDSKYLEAAAEGARWLLATLWVQPTVPDGEYTTDAEAIKKRNLLSGTTGMWWKGTVQGRVGNPDNLDSLKNETVPAWVVSRVGIGVEQTFEFTTEVKEPEKEFRFYLELVKQDGTVERSQEKVMAKG